MYKLKTGLMFICIVLSLQSAEAAMKKSPMDKVMYKTTVERWVRTTSAEVTITVDAAAPAGGITDLRGTVLAQLKQIVDGEWHITQVSQSKDASGLERIRMIAQTRVDENQLKAVRERAEKISQPGVNFQVDRIAFHPTLAEVEQTRAELRQDLYQQIADELKRLRDAYPKQDYSVHRINMLGLRVYGRRAKQLSYAETPMAMQRTSLPTSQKVTQSAYVVFAAMRKNGG